MEEQTKEIESAWKDYLELPEVKEVWTSFLSEGDRVLFRTAWKQGFLLGYQKGMKFGHRVCLDVLRDTFDRRKSNG